MTPTLQDLNLTASDLTDKIESEISLLSTLKIRFEGAKVNLENSPFSDCIQCDECQGSGRSVVSYNVGYDDWESDEELCEYCLMDGVYPWDIKTSWLSLDQDDEGDLLEEQAWDVDCTPPEVLKEYQETKVEAWSIAHSIEQDLSVLGFHHSTTGQGDIKLLKEQLSKVIEWII